MTDTTQTVPHPLLRHLWGLALRHYYLLKGSWPRVLEMLYWPVINIATWGFTGVYLVQKFTGVTVVSNIMIASVLMVEIYTRISVITLMLFMEEIWSRNLGHLFASPLRFREYICGVTCVCLTRAVLALTPAILVAKFLFGFSLFSLGWPLATYIPLLAVNGCWYGFLIIAMLMRFGLASEWMAWMAVWLFVPIVSPYYPISVLPHALQILAHCLPATYVFESIKGQLNHQPAAAANLWIALGLNTFYTALSAVIVWRSYRGAQRRGGLLQMGE